MNIIICRKAHAAPCRIDLADRRARFLAVAGFGGCALFFIVIGAIAALAVASPRNRDLREIAQLRANIAAQRSQLAGVSDNSRRNLDALAMQLGRLQAQATRLNALGDRLTQVGKLDDGEFDFTSEPALGGPDGPSVGIGGVLPLKEGLDGLSAQFDNQEVQLDVLENLLRDRKIDNSLLPHGMPVAHGYISSGYGERSDPFNGHQEVHLGVDFSAPKGTPVTAVAQGVVTFAGERNGYGRVVEIDHGNGYMTRYAHNSAITAKVGARVHIGDVIAKVGSSGRSTGPHCHFEVWHNGHAVNPMAYVKATHPTHA